MANIFDLFRQIEKKETTSPTPVTHMIVGLGNPGDKYVRTRHNAGFLAIDHLANAYGAALTRSRFHSLCAEVQMGGHHVLLLKPQTMMNASGLAVQEAAAFYKIPAKNILVLSDDITRDAGRLRLRRDGSAGCHNGLKDIITCLGTDAFPRLRFGVGAKPHPDYDLAAWVLSNFTDAEYKRLIGSFDDVHAGILKYLADEWDAAMQICNSHTPD